MAPFKKGAFHLAIQAGVPIVPIVIHNALDVAPKGDFAFRAATVMVDVLPPVDTRVWRRETIDQHVAEVRGMYLKALGQEEVVVPTKTNRLSADGPKRIKATRKRVAAPAVKPVVSPRRGRRTAAKS